VMSRLVRRDEPDGTFLEYVRLSTTYQSQFADAIPDRQV
jgi:hypothetical protein